MFDDLIKSIAPRIPIRIIHKLAWICLHRLHTREETEELRGISQTTEIDMYLLICLNTVLDLLMGCTSGGVRVKAHSPDSTSMLHFRTLDWGMDPLRDLIVQLEFVRDSDPNKVLATSITYVGFVGILTGVREGLSASLNFRPVHDTTRNFAFYANHLFVLLGLRQSISSLVRQCILPPETQDGTSMFSTLADITANVPQLATTAAYLIFSDGATTVTMEKDHRTAVVRSSSSFIVTTNHDQGSDSASPKEVADSKRDSHVGLSLVSPDIQTMASLIDDSNERHECMEMKWKAEVRKQNEQAHPALARREIPQTVEPSGSRSSLRLRKQREAKRQEAEDDERFIGDLSMDDDSTTAITKYQLLHWLATFPVLNESTHYATLMDPSAGKIAWVRRYDPSEWDWAEMY